MSIPPVDSLSSTFSIPKLATLPKPTILGPVAKIHTGYTCSDQIAFDSDRIITVAPDGSIQVWDKRQLSLIHSLTGHPGYDSESLTVKGDRLLSYASCGVGGQIQIWDLRRGILLKKFESNRFFVVDNDCLIQAGTTRDGVTWGSNKIWNLDGELVCSFGTAAIGWLAPESFSCVPVLSGRDYVITGHYNGSVNVWNKYDGSHMATLAAAREGKQQSITVLHVQGDHIIWGNEQGEISCSHLLFSDISYGFSYLKSTNSEERSLLMSLVISDDLLISKFGGFINVWQKDTRAFLYSYPCSGNADFLLVDENRLVFRDSEGSILVIDKRDGLPLLKIDESDESYFSFKIFKNLLMAICRSKKIRIWNLEDGSLLSELEADSYYIIDGSRLMTHSAPYSGGEAGHVYIYELSALIT